VDKELWVYIRSCLGVLLLFVIFAGVTVDGRHYGIAGCTSNNGVNVEWGVQR
jgi:hypothetical protein